jgi:hypothetical protein
MTTPFQYPAVPHVRRHGPAGYADYESYRPWLRDEFTFRCVYCLTRETWGPFRAHFAIDHFVAAARLPDAPPQYDNLLYSCVTCNAAKGDRSVPDPLTEFLAEAVRVDRDGVLHGETNSAARLIELLELNHPRMVEFRGLVIAIVALAERYDPDFCRRMLGFPGELPDLASLKPHGGNSRLAGIAESYFARRQRGELPDRY